MMLFVILLHDLLRCLHILLQQLDFTILRQHLRCTETNAGHVDINGTLHTPSTGFPHPLPVLERITDQQIRRYRRNRIIPVTHFYRIQSHFYHSSVGAIFRHSNPVAYFQHIIGRKLNTRNKTHNTILEHQHQDSGRSSQSGKQHHRTLLNQNTYDNNGPDKEKNDLSSLQQPLQRLVLILLLFTVNMIYRRQKDTDETEENRQDINKAKPSQEIEQVGVGMFRKSDGNSKVNQYRGYHPADVNHHLMVEHYVVPSSFGLFHQFRYRTQNDLTANQIS